MMPLAGRRADSLEKFRSSTPCTSTSRQCDSPFASQYKLWIRIASSCRLPARLVCRADYRQCSLGATQAACPTEAVTPSVERRGLVDRIQIVNEPKQVRHSKGAGLRRREY